MYQGLDDFAYTGNSILYGYPDSFQMWLAESQNSERIVLSADSYGEAAVDLSPVLRTFIGRSPSVSGPRFIFERSRELNRDAYIHLPDPDEPDRFYHFIRGVLQVGESAPEYDATRVKHYILSDIIKLALNPTTGVLDKNKYRVYYGFPILVPFLISRVEPYSLSVRTSITGEDTNLGVNNGWEAGICNLSATFLPTDSECWVSIINWNQAYITLSCVFDPMDAPEHPFYVRWINNHGGWETWMFSCRHKRMRRLDENTYYETAGAYGESEGIYHTLNKTGIEIAEVSSGIVSRELYDILSKLQYSPLIQYYDINSSSWIEIQVDKGDAEWMTDTPKNEYVISFVLPKVQMNK